MRTVAPATAARSACRARSPRCAAHSIQLPTERRPVEEPHARCAGSSGGEAGDAADHADTGAKIPATAAPATAAAELAVVQTCEETAVPYNAAEPLAVAAAAQRGRQIVGSSRAARRDVANAARFNGKSFKGSCCFRAQVITQKKYAYLTADSADLRRIWRI